MLNCIIIELLLAHYKEAGVEMGRIGALKLSNFEFSEELDFFDLETVKQSFINWLVKVQGFPVDGFIVKGLNKYITSMKQLDLFHDHYDSVFKKNSEYLTQCSIDIIHYIRDNKPLPHYLEN